ncbi:undecaprenyldiphospho-muramoylpentapeptide beta-N-acetylglucosaminyltransferase [Candidatus Latescibacterota bacterium]
MRVMFAGGGTGGHIYPALAIAGEMMNKLPEVEILFMAGTRGIERKIFSDAGFDVKTISVVGLPRKMSPALVPFAWKLVMSIARSRRYLKGFRPSVVIATGGYVSGPPVIAAYMMGIPVVIHEQNSFPGITNKKLGRFAEIVFLGFQDAVKYFEGKAKTMVTGNPVRSEIGTGEREASRDKFSLDSELKTVLVFGGSQGSHAINTVLGKVVDKITKKGIQVLWQTGRKEFEENRKYEGLSKGRVRVLPYIDDMVSAYAAADMVVSRAGAMTVAEITACGLPAVIIPLPTAAENHQEYNARSLVSSGSAVMIVEKDLTPEVLEREITRILTSEETLSTMSEASRKMGKKDAAGLIAGVLIERYGMN